MAKQTEKLGARKVETAGPGRYGDGDGLWLVVAPSGGKKWVYRFTANGKVTEMGLGSVKDVSLKQAREARDNQRRVLKSGQNPIEAKREAKRAEAEEKTGKPTFGKIADDLIESKGADWKNEKHRAQWKMTLEVYAKALRPKPVDEITTADLLAVLQPIWQSKPETASRLRGRIEAVLDAARVRGLIPANEANPARWRGHLELLLSKPAKLARGHHAALAYADVPVFVARLREREALAALALELVILTATRTSEVLGAEWSEVDFAAKLWTLPAARMKATREHRVPLSDRALAIFEKLAQAKTDPRLVFPGQRRGKPLSIMSMAMLLRRMGMDDVTVHGFRSAFRDWAGDATAFPREVIEQALAHAIGDKTEAAYRRSDALEKRRALMTAWGVYCEPKEAGSNVVSIAGRAKA